MAKDCQSIFEELKKYLSSSPLLIKPKKLQILYLYIGIPNKVVISVLIKKCKEEVETSVLC